MLLIQRTTADKNLQPHCSTVCCALGALFEAPIDGDDDVSRAVRRSVLGLGELNFDKKVVDFTNNLHLALLVKAGLKQVIWESELKPARRTVLNPIDNQVQQLLVDWIGAYFIFLLSVLLTNLLYVIAFRRELVPRRRKT